MRRDEGIACCVFLEGKQGVKEVRIAPVTNQVPLIQFDRYVAINTPVRLVQGVSKLDEFYHAPLDWPATNRTDDIENTFLKVAALSQGTLTPQTSLPFNAIESKFLIGLTFRLALRDIIYSSQQRNNQGVLHHPISTISGATRCIRKSSSIPTRIILTNLRSRIIRPMALPRHGGNAGKSRRLADV